MSVKAHAWVTEQRQVSNAEYRLLSLLAECHNGSTGQCNPKQTWLADRGNMSRSTVNSHLKTLEEKHLLHRIQGRDDATKRQKSTIYIFPFDEGFPCPESGHGINGEPSPESGHGIECDPSPDLGQSRVRISGSSESDSSDSNRTGMEPEIEPESLSSESEREKNEMNEKEVEKLFSKMWEPLPEKARTTSSRSAALAEWKKLSDEERESAVTGVAMVYQQKLSAGSKYLHAVKTVLIDKSWLELSKPDDGQQQSTPDALIPVKPMTKAWHYLRMETVLKGPRFDNFKTDLEEKILNSFDDPNEAQSYQLKLAWKHMEQLDNTDSAFRMRPRQELGNFEDYVHVTVGSDQWNAWMTWFELKQAPPPDMRGFPHAFFPTEWPDLSEFKVQSADEAADELADLEGV